MTTNDDKTMATRPVTGIIPRTLDDVARMAKMAHASGLAKVSSPEAAGVILLTGAELGLSPMQSLRGIYVIDGKPVLSADLMVAVVKRSDVCVYWRTIESTPETCTIETQREREPSPVRKTWTTRDADRAGLLGKKPWQQYPADMLRHRAAATLAREVYPDLLLGLYTPDELEVIDVRAEPDEAPRQPVEVPRVVERDPPRDHRELADLGIEQPRETPAAPVAEPASDAQLPPAAEPASDAQLPPAVEAFARLVAEVELPGECVALWVSRRTELAALAAADREVAWRALCDRCAEVGRMTPKAAKVWLKKAISEETARRAEAQTIAPTEVQS